MNIKRLTKAKLVGVSEILPQFIWNKYLLEAQGYQNESSIVYQDNMSDIQIYKNILGLSSNRTHHINIRYFFKTDLVRSKELSIEYCPTDDIIAVFLLIPFRAISSRNFKISFLTFSIYFSKIMIIIIGLCWVNCESTND